MITYGGIIGYYNDELPKVNEEDVWGGVIWIYILLFICGGCINGAVLVNY